MAHVEKYTRAQTGQLCQHYERKMINGEYVKFGNENIDLNKTYLNYNLAPEHNQIKFIQERCQELNCLKRKDVNVMCSWVITKPKDLSEVHEEDFFKNTYKFLEDRYGKDNVVSSYVHKDEVTPHMHFVFVPVVHDKKKDKDKVSAKECINKLELKTFHQDLDKYLEQSMGFKVNVLNEATRDGNKEVAELKKETLAKQVQELENELKEVSKVTGDIIDTVKDIKPRKSFIGNNITITEKEYSSLKTLALNGASILLKDSKKQNNTLELQEAVKELEYSLDKANQNIESYKNILKEYEPKVKKFNLLEKVIERLELDEKIQKEIQNMQREFEKTKNIIK